MNKTIVTLISVFDNPFYHTKYKKFKQKQEELERKLEDEYERITEARTYQIKEMDLISQ